MRLVSYESEILANFQNIREDPKYEFVCIRILYEIRTSDKFIITNFRYCYEKFTNLTKIRISYESELNFGHKLQINFNTKRNETKQIY